MAEETTSAPRQDGGAASAAGPTGRAELMGLILAIAIPAGLVSLWASPRPARPAEMPALVLPAREVAAALAAQDALAAEAVDDDDETQRRGLYLAHGLAEVRMDDSPEEAQGRSSSLARIARGLAERDPRALAAVRARDVTRVMPALRGEQPRDATERASELGVFPAMLERYGAIVEGHRVAPELVIRTMFLARWNAIHGIEMTDGMSALERRAYYGWLALEGGSAPLGMRLEAIDAYAAAGGTRVWEARGVLEFESGEMGAARSDFEHACDLGGSLRLRNHALAAAMVEAESAE